MVTRAAVWSTGCNVVDITRRTPRRPLCSSANTEVDDDWSPFPRENRLLAALPAIERELLYPQLEETSLRAGDVLYEPGAELRHVYFPTTSIVSIVHAIENGSSAEVAIVGNEGIIGVSVYMGGEMSASRA